MRLIIFPTDSFEDTLAFPAFLDLLANRHQVLPPASIWLKRLAVRIETNLTVKVPVTGRTVDYISVVCAVLAKATIANGCTTMLVSFLVPFVAPLAKVTRLKPGGQRRQNREVMVVEEEVHLLCTVELFVVVNDGISPLDSNNTNTPVGKFLKTEIV